jgi:glutamate synthase domain-containing protein 1
MNAKPPLTGLYQPGFEKDSCGFGLIANIDDKPSHWLVKTSIEALARLTHRGAVAADGKSGDGCGLLLKKPDDFLRAQAKALGIHCARRYAVGLVFISPFEGETEASQQVIADRIAAQGLEIAGWREVPTDPTSTRPKTCRAPTSTACSTSRGAPPARLSRRRTTAASRITTISRACPTTCSPTRAW